MVKNKLLALTTLLLLSLPLCAQDNRDVAADLRERLDDMTSLQGEFTQTLTDADGMVLEESKGHFVMARPGKFDWQTTEPFEQRLVSDNETIWLYDPDLMQVTVRDYNRELQETPALILSDELTELSERFEVTHTESEAGLDVFSLKPREDEGLFRSLSLVFDGRLLREIRMYDNLDQVSYFELRDLERNVDVDDSRFTFEPPEGVDVLRD
ncbi:outer membrane lipoprotein chaperone LolA [Marinimicrobium sp. C2-29]|uniref:outer membrane lipoprotein chaperone LolA n=1 Tax=Marinimicrobium sp. C2-29 TaxID=3139825 RepID=UPI0031387564